MVTTRSLTGGRSMKTIEAPITHQSHAHFILFCEEGLPSGLFLYGGRLTNFLDSGISM